MANIFERLMSAPVEDEVLEWKERKTQIDSNELGQYFSALSNEANLNGKKCAHLILGVKNDKTPVGTDWLKDPKHQNSVKQSIATGTGGYNFLSLIEENVSGKRIVILQIPAAPRGIPVAWKGQYYGRVGESLTPLNIEEIERIRNQNAREDWSAVICDGASIEDLDREAIKKARAGFILKNPKINPAEINSWDDVTFLNKAKIIIDGKITRTAILLLGKPESEHFLLPGTPKISWILKDTDGIEKDYEHFGCPLVLNVDSVYSKIRNLRYRYITDGSLFPDEIEKYDPITIREAINNCIAHQDYSLGGRISVVENEDSLVFANSGSFIPGSIEKVIDADSPPEYYRNRFLAQAMVGVNMIDTIGSGIKKMFLSQKKKFFPMPEFDLTNHKVQLTIIGKVLDVAYAKKLVQIPDLDLKTIMELDKVQKRKKLTQEENKNLRQRGLIEGRYPNVFISSYAAKRTGDQSSYMKRRGIEDGYAKQMILDYIQKFGEAERKDLLEMLLEKLPDFLSEQQKIDKVKNLLQSLKKEGKIKLTAKKTWVKV